MTDRWRYAQGNHPPYCTCVECSDYRQQSVTEGGKARKNRFLKWLTDVFRRPSR